MALVLKDRVKETTTTQGTGTISLLGAVQGYQGFSSIGIGNTTYYCIQDTADWEVGIGTVGAGSLTRDTVLASSNNGSLVGFGSGVKDVFCTYPAGKSVSTDSLPVTGAISSASPNATVNVASLTSAVTTTNGDLALVKKGTGALLAQVPTGTDAGGNKRGQYAVDLVGFRSNAANVASGDYSVLGGGYDNKASASYSVVAGGQGNFATGNSSFIGGGIDNQANNISSGVAGGRLNVASADYAMVGGGRENVASGGYSSVGGGISNTASGLWSGVGSGLNNIASGGIAYVASGGANTASGDYSFVAGGSDNVASGNVSAVIGGVYGTTRGIIGYLVTPASDTPIEAKAGVQQSGCLIVGVQTTNATATKLRSNSSAAGATNQLILQNNSAALLYIDLIGWDQTDYITVNVINGLIVRGANAASTVLKSPGYQNYEKSTGASTWLMALSADTTNGGLVITVTGQASKTIRWVARIFATEVGF